MTFYGFLKPSRCCYRRFIFHNIFYDVDIMKQQNLWVYFACRMLVFVRNYSTSNNTNNETTLAQLIRKFRRISRPNKRSSYERQTLNTARTLIRYDYFSTKNSFIREIKNNRNTPVPDRLKRRKNAA